MKKLNFHAMYLLTFIFFNNCFGFSLTNNRVVKTVREHKKKVIFLVVVGYFLSIVYNTNSAFDNIKAQIIGGDVDYNKLPKEFDTILNSPFLSKSNKQSFINLIKKYNLREWTVGSHTSTGKEYFHKQ